MGTSPSRSQSKANQPVTLLATPEIVEDGHGMQVMEQTIMSLKMLEI